MRSARVTTVPDGETREIRRSESNVWSRRTSACALSTLPTFGNAERHLDQAHVGDRHVSAIRILADAGTSNGNEKSTTSLLLFVVAVGLFVYGACCLIEARYRKL